ncbi:ribonuclease J [Pelagibius sp. Alg239-R121]|uniref:ribonuclease J n=1 Tax=Pelagibius sp. Alg239-R121 TaxID=2993448 RepID=UPI0024A75968|nr:ribonuclease J [Pelagibius sp. Alg239-R121]
MKPKLNPGNDELFFLPLGGAGEIGMNLNLYGHDGQWLMVDLGITFAGPELPGVDVLMPDPRFIVERREQLVGLMLTHAHEDHIGAVPYLWSQLRCPIYATPFTRSMVERKLKEAGLYEAAPITEIPMSGRFSVGHFEIELITLTHSIPEPNAVVIHTPAGNVLHTGDWKLDDDPLVGDTFDEARLKALADEDVLAMVCDSTNALNAEETGSESEVREHLMELVGGLEQRVAIACFASNVARFETIVRAAEAHGRRVALLGRSMHRIHEAARENGYMPDLPPFLSEKDIDYLPRNEVLLLCTGSQGEPRSALWRIAHGDHREVHLDEGDAVIFSSRVIPGNETSIFALQNTLVKRGIQVITDDDAFIHVSGHPGRPELAQMYQWVRPRVAVPVHGEQRHLTAHAELARECQVPEQIAGENGALIRLAPGRAKVIDQVQTGRLAVEGSRLLSTESPILRERQRMAYNGAAAVTLALNAKGTLVDEPQLTFHGVYDDDLDEDQIDDVLDAIEQAIQSLRPAERRDDASVAEAVRVAVRRSVKRDLEKKPVTTVHVVRLESDRVPLKQ